MQILQIIKDVFYGNCAKLDLMDTELKNFIGFWNENLPNEQTLESLQRIHPNASDLWAELERRKWLRKGASGKCGLAPQAIHFFEHRPQRISHARALLLITNVCQRIQQWNSYAHAKGLPTIAATAVWGSVARPDTRDHGDVDISLVWRHNERKHSIQTAAPVACNENDRWDIEDKVEQWVASDPLISISGVDQWEEFGEQKDFHARLICTDGDWDNNDTGVSSLEAHIMRKYANTWLEMDAKCVKMYKR